MRILRECCKDVAWISRGYCTDVTQILHSFCTVFAKNSEGFNMVKCRFVKNSEQPCKVHHPVLTPNNSNASNGSTESSNSINMNSMNMNSMNMVANIYFLSNQLSEF